MRCFSHAFLIRVSSWGISRCFRRLSPSLGQVTYVLLTRSPLSRQSKSSFSFDLHVLGTPPAFILSQDQTLRMFVSRSVKQTVRFWFLRRGGLPPVVFRLRTSLCAVSSVVVKVPRTISLDSPPNKSPTCWSAANGRLITHPFPVCVCSVSFPSASFVCYGTLMP
jgi:hypothetical protein